MRSCKIPRDSRDLYADDASAECFLGHPRQFPFVLENAVAIVLGDDLASHGLRRFGISVHLDGYDVVFDL